MIGVIVVPGPSARMHGLDTKRSLALLPLCDRPLLQHIVESLVAQGITSIELLVGHAPEEVEDLLGNGDRWGCRFRYHLEAQSEYPYRSLKVIPDLGTEPWLLIHAERYPYFTLPTGPVTTPVLVQRSLDGLPGNGMAASEWGGAAVLPAGTLGRDFAGMTQAGLSGHLATLSASGAARVVAASHWLDASTPAALLESQTMLLEGRLPGFTIGGIERRPGIWVSRNVVIHPSAELVGPLYIGANSRLNRDVRLGANTVIGSECIVDTNTTIEHSLVTAGSYVGEGLELNNAVVNHNLLVNVRLDTSVDIVESFLLGGIKERKPRYWFGRSLQAFVAILLMVVTLPITLLAVLYYALARRIVYSHTQRVQLPCEEGDLEARSYALPCLGTDAWNVQRRAGWSAFLRQFLPGLRAVVRARIGFVGLPPRTPEEIRALSPEWRFLYLQNKAGLITEASIATGATDDQTDLYVADAYYVVRCGFWYDLRLALQYFSRLILPR